MKLFTKVHFRRLTYSNRIQEHTTAWDEYKIKTQVIFFLPMLCPRPWSRRLLRSCLQWALVPASIMVVSPSFQTLQYLCRWGQKWNSMNKNKVPLNSVTQRLFEGAYVQNRTTAPSVSGCIMCTPLFVILITTKRFIEVKSTCSTFVLNTFSP